MKLALTIFAILGLLSGPAAAQGVLFDFNTAPLHASLPVTLTVGDLTATVAATGQASPSSRSRRADSRPSASPATGSRTASPPPTSG